MTLLVPYRDREEHLKEFIAALGSKHRIVVIEQCDEKPFNRGKLLNVGFLEVMPDSFVANDVDMIGHQMGTYIERLGVHQLCTSEIQPSRYLGGATMFDKETFSYLEGYHNDYFHRAEDNEMMFRTMDKSVMVSQHNFAFIRLAHPRTGPEFIPELWQKAQLPRTKNMLKTCEYQLISKAIKEGYTLIKVLL